MVTSARKLPGVIGVRADPETKRLIVRYDGAVTDDATLIAAIRTIADNIH